MQVDLPEVQSLVRTGTKWRGGSARAKAALPTIHIVGRPDPCTEYTCGTRGDWRSPLARALPATRVAGMAWRRSMRRTRKNETIRNKPVFTARCGGNGRYLRESFHRWGEGMICFDFVLIVQVFFCNFKVKVSL